jgi:hypothetical protein
MPYRNNFLFSLGIVQARYDPEVLCYMLTIEQSPVTVLAFDAGHDHPIVMPLSVDSGKTKHIPFTSPVTILSPNMTFIHVQ